MRELKAIGSIFLSVLNPETAGRSAPTLLLCHADEGLPKMWVMEEPPRPPRSPLRVPTHSGPPDCSEELLCLVVPWPSPLPHVGSGSSPGAPQAAR